MQYTHLTYTKRFRFSLVKWYTTLLQFYHEYNFNSLKFETLYRESSVLPIIQFPIINKLHLWILNPEGLQQSNQTKTDGIAHLLGGIGIFIAQGQDLLRQVNESGAHETVKSV